MSAQKFYNGAEGGRVQNFTVSRSDTGKFYITTAIVYVNDKPGLHYIYEQIGSDAIARFHRQRGREVLFLTGTDENATTVDRAAKANGEDTRKFVDRLAATYEKAAKLYGISHDRFIRTTDADHVAAVQEFVHRWIANGDVYESSYEGLYCVSCEAFYEETDLVDGKCPFHTPRATIERLSEQNYFFRLSKYQKALEDLYRDDPGFCEPEIRRNEVLGWIKRGLKDISVSRRGLTWGIPWPGDPGQTIYVWFDALINYVTGAGFGTDDAKLEKWWPADLHVIGKDITRFHCIYWPAMLMSAGIELPKRVWVHGFLNYGGQRLSKSTGNMIDPFAAAEEWGADAVRYLLLRQVGFASDGDVSPDIFSARFNAELANGVGNTVQRTLTMIDRYCGAAIPQDDPGSALAGGVRDAATRAMREHDDAAAAFRFSDSLGTIVALLTAVDRMYTETKPWELSKLPERRGELDAVLYAGAEAIRIASLLLWPYAPAIAAQIAQRLGQPDPGTAWERGARWGALEAGTHIRVGEPLFPRLERTVA